MKTYKSINKKFILPFIIIVLLVNTLMFIVITFYDYNQSLDAQELKLRNYSELISESLSYPMWNYDRTSIETIGDALTENENISYVSIIDTSKNEEFYLYEKESVTGDTYLTSSVLFNKQEVGSIRIGISNDVILNQLLGDIMVVVIQTLVLSAVVIYVTLRLLRTVTKPINDLTSLTEKFRDGEMSSRSQIKTNDEIEFLGNVFNEMADSIEKQISDIKFMGTHDILTGVYSRSHFENNYMEFENPDLLPTTIMNIDLNGLKHVNNTYGYEKGDEQIKRLAEFLSQNIDLKNARIFRWGGDDFIILLSKVSESQARQIKKNLTHKLEVFNNSLSEEYKLDFSIGYNTRTTQEMSIITQVREAEAFMNREKLLNSRSSNSSVMNYLTSTLNERSEETFEHADRLWQYSKLMAEELDLTDDEMVKLKLFSVLHDIGKIAISDVILNKPARLTDDEWIEMRKHPEIGYRLSRISPELEVVSEYILTHHENWDGTGYPRGLKGEEIPLLSRILTISDAYDAMVEDRVYRKGMTQDDAFNELIRCSDTQFERRLVEIFINKMKV